MNLRHRTTAALAAAALLSGLAAAPAAAADSARPNLTSGTVSAYCKGLRWSGLGVTLHVLSIWGKSPCPLYRR